MLTLAEYLRELKLTERQYGQEDGLYPLIYMLLWECMKEKDLSIRAVANAKKSKKIPGRKALMGYGTMPDIVILDELFCEKSDRKEEQSKRVYGCIEVKASNQEYDKIIFKILNVKNKQLTLRFQKKEIKNGEIEVLNHSMSATEFNPNMSATKFNEDKDEKKFVEYNDKKYYRNITEFIAELLWYGKVLYTNGKVWKFIELSGDDDEHDEKNTLKKRFDGGRDWRTYIHEKKTVVKCYEIGNLEEMCKDVKSADAVDRQVVLYADWQQEWARLKYNLASIDWTGTNDSSKFILKEDENGK